MKIQWSDLLVTIFCFWYFCCCCLLPSPPFSGFMSSSPEVNSVFLHKSSVWRRELTASYLKCIKTNQKKTKGSLLQIWRMLQERTTSTLVLLPQIPLSEFMSKRMTSPVGCSLLGYGVNTLRNVCNCLTEPLIFLNYGTTNQRHHVTKK